MAFHPAQIACFDVDELFRKELGKGRMLEGFLELEIGLNQQLVAQNNNLLFKLQHLDLQYHQHVNQLQQKHDQQQKQDQQQAQGQLQLLEAQVKGLLGLQAKQTQQLQVQAQQLTLQYQEFTQLGQEYEKR